MVNNNNDSPLNRYRETGKADGFIGAQALPFGKAFLMGFKEGGEWIKH